MFDEIALFYSNDPIIYKIGAEYRGNIIKQINIDDDTGHIRMIIEKDGHKGHVDIRGIPYETIKYPIK